MVMAPSFLFGDIMHTRIFPARNAFRYKIFYMAFPLDDLNKMNSGLLFGINRPAIMSFWNSGHGDRDGGDLKNWLLKTLDGKNIKFIQTPKIILVTMPRVFGYVFNPVSFYLCFNTQDELEIVLCEVNNTFGETHSYICTLNEKNADGWVYAEKVFHVSPFLPRNGSYKLKFKMDDTKLNFQIDYFDEHNEKQLVTILSGKWHDFNKKNMLKSLFGYPLITLRAIYLIHWQALRLWFKKQKFYPKPSQMNDKVTFTTDNIKNM